ncbi:MAG: hypothetical protein L0099_03835 [Acidobacteria bacterium]|nr:hypothetical protein [Acidobacteriota bacterium]
MVKEGQPRKGDTHPKAGGVPGRGRLGYVSAGEVARFHTVRFELSAGSKTRRHTTRPRALGYACLTATSRRS